MYPFQFVPPRRLICDAILPTQLRVESHVVRCVLAKAII